MGGSLASVNEICLVATCGDLEGGDISHTMSEDNIVPKQCFYLYETTVRNEVGAHVEVSHNIILW